MTADDEIGFMASVMAVFQMHQPYLGPWPYAWLAEAWTRVRTWARGGKDGKTNGEGR